MSYKVCFPTPAVEKKFEKLLEDVFPASDRIDILDEIEALAIEPRPHGSIKIKPPIHVHQFVAQHRIRIGDWRVLYDIDDTRKKVWILTLRRRGEDTYL